MPKYDEGKLYKDLRCKLIHSYSEGGSYLFKDGKPNLHLEKDSSGKTFINLEDFINEIDEALSCYESNLLNNLDLIKKAIKRYNKNGIIQVKSLSSLSIPVSGSNI